MSQKDKKIKQPTCEEIAKLAYSLYEKDGFSQGRDLEHWLQAEALLKTGGQNGSKTANKKVKSLNDLPSVNQ